MMSRHIQDYTAFLVWEYHNVRTKIVFTEKDCNLSSLIPKQFMVVSNTISIKSLWLPERVD